MAFGFLVARSEVFLHNAVRWLGGGRQPAAGPHAGSGGVVGAVPIVAGTMMVTLAAVRFARTRRAIDNAGTATVAADLVLAAMMAMLGLSVVHYLARTLADVL